MANLFHPLIATIAIVKVINSFSLKCLPVASYNESETSFSEINVKASVQANAARSRWV